MKHDLLEKVKDALAKSLNLSSADGIHAGTRLKEELKLDSMTSLTFLMALEDCVPGFQVDADTLSEKDLASVETVVEYIEKTVSQ